MILLDPLTLALIITIVSLWQLLVIGLLYRLAPAYPGVRLWMVGLAFQTASTGLATLGGPIPPLASIIIANALGLIGSAVLVAGIGHFLGRPIRRWAALSGTLIAATMLAYIFFTYILASVVARSALLLLCTAILYGGGAALLLGAAPPHLRSAARFSGAILAFEAAWPLISAIALLTNIQPPGMAAPVSNLAPLVILASDLLITAGLAGLIIQSLLYNLDQTQERERAGLTAANRSMEQRLFIKRLLVNHLPDTAVLLFDANLRYTLAAGQALKNVGIVPEEVEGRTMSDVLPPDRAATLLPYYRSALAGEPQHIEYERAGRFYHVQFVAVPDAMAEQGMRGMVVTRDVTVIKQAEASLMAAKEAAEASDRSKSAFLAHMSHEIRTPLNAVIGMTDMLKATPLSPDQLTYVTTIQTGGEALLALVNTILDLAKIEAGQFVLGREPVDLRRLLDDARSLVAQSAVGKGLALRATIDPQVPAAVLGDAARLRQILINLLANAVKFTAAGEVSLSTTVRPMGDGRQELIMAVRDSGIGIAPEGLAQVFRPFIQADVATARRYGGTGLGLTISRQLAELMGGSIEVESSIGVGSIFTLRLPVEATAAPPTVPLPAPTAPAHALRLLVAEDNQVNQLVIRQLLRRLGLEADLVADGAAAVEAVARRDYDLVLMDIQMPEMDGDDAAQAIRALGAAARQPIIVALTASVMAGDRERYLMVGMDECLSKPVTLAALSDLLARLPARREAPAEAGPP